jgi:hypothetical protein
MNDEYSNDKKKKKNTILKFKSNRILILKQHSFTATSLQLIRRGLGKVGRKGYGG